MSSLPRNVFTTCPEVASARKSIAKPDEYTIRSNDGIEVKELAIIKGQITLDDVKKASKCAKINPFVVTLLGSSTTLNIKDFPIKANLVIKKPKVMSLLTNISTPVMRQPEYGIYNGINNVVLLCKNGIAKSDIEKAAKCARLTNYVVTKNARGLVSPLKIDGNTFLKCNIYFREAPVRKPQVFHVCEQTTVAPVRNTTPTVAVLPITNNASKRKLIKDAIAGLNGAITALKALENSL